MFNSSKIKSNFSYKVTIPDNFNFFYYINLLALVEVLAKLAKLVVETVDLAINLNFNRNPNLNFTKTEL